MATANDNDRGASSRGTASRSQAIVAAATELFLANGYLGTSMDDVAARASASKQTIYKRFGDKEALFAEIVDGIISEYTDPYFNEVAALQDTGDLERDLAELGRRLLRLLMQPGLLQLRRLVIGEASRFPELGRRFSERGPQRSIAALAEAFDQLAHRGLLSFDDAQLAASHYNWLVVSIPLNVAMLTGSDAPFTDSELDRFADQGARAFVAAYGRSDETPRHRSRPAR